VANWFDELSKNLSQERSRRGALRLLTGALIGAGAAAFGGPQPIPMTSAAPNPNKKQCQVLLGGIRDARKVVELDEKPLAQLQKDAAKLQADLNQALQARACFPPSDPKELERLDKRIQQLKDDIQKNQTLQQAQQVIIDTARQQLQQITTTCLGLGCPTCDSGLDAFAPSNTAVADMSLSGAASLLSAGLPVDAATPPGVCSCGAQNCASGCCQVGTCQPGTSPQACGTGGGTCAVCPTGTACVAGSCQCTPQSCPSGCCQNGQCLSGTSSAACGLAGTCAQCASGEQCVNHACVGCTPQSCSNGCCVPGLNGAPGTCQSPPNNQFCGANGATCIACGANQTCQNGACVCAAPAVQCGTSCCPAGSTCGANNTCQAACPAGVFPCGSTACCPNVCRSINTTKCDAGCCNGAPTPICCAAGSEVCFFLGATTGAQWQCCPPGSCCGPTGCDPSYCALHGEPAFCA
jgi:hypothetical protein